MKMTEKARSSVRDAARASGRWTLGGGRAVGIAGLGVALSAFGVVGCGRSTTSGTPSASSSAPARVNGPTASATSSGAAVGPDILSTTGADAATPTDVKARFAHFQIAPVNGVDTLLVDGKPVSYQDAAGGALQPIQANSTLTLVGVFELQGESVAWVIIGGGAACAGTHVLVPAGKTQTVQGIGLPGCDDRGTMRKSGDRIVLDVGGQSGAYDHGRVVAN